MDIGALFKQSWERFSANIGMGIVIYIVGGFVAGLAGMLTLGIASIPVVAGMLKSMRKIQQGDAPDFSDLFSEFSNFGKWFMAWLVFVGIGICAGIVSLIPILGQLVAPLIGLALGFLLFFTFHLMLDRGLAAFDAVKASIDYVKSNVGSLAGPILLTMIVQGLFAIITGPWMAIQAWEIYDRTIGAGASEPTPNYSQTMPPAE